MARVGAWRGHAFQQDVHFETVASDDRGRDGWYDADRRILVLVDQSRSYPSDLVLVHELTHALQDQRFDLAQASATPDSPDAARAWLALVEGEATLASAELVGFRIEDHPSHAPGSADSEVDRLLFTYMTGAQYVAALREDGGWPAVDAAWQTPPPSTAHIHQRVSGTSASLATEPTSASHTP